MVRHRLQREEGASAVEFAIIASLLFLIVFGIIEYGRIYSEYQVFQAAAREGARVAAVRGSMAEIEARVNEATGPYTKDQPVSVSVSDGGAGDPPCSSSTVGESVTVSWTQNFKVLVGLLPPLNRNIVIKGVFRCE
ncbi:MAG TPA: TadE family protein [Actinomycetota bacterium]|jgi:Flp pilus assembly protein TadG|nr:TadE family protein [Actinomycetota bacterium]